MPRIRSLKPDFFTDEDLAEHPFWVRILFEGLWCQADREGRLEDRPKKLKAVIFPYDSLEIEAGLQLLTQKKRHSPRHEPFIIRYEAEGNRYIQVINFEKHQSPQTTEQPSKIPSCENAKMVEEQFKNGLGEVPKLSQPNTKTLNPKPLNLKPKKTSDLDDERLAQLLIELMLKNNPESSIIKHLTPPRRFEWVEAARLMRERDGKTTEEIGAVIRFSQEDDFWKTNILSMPKLRDKWDQLWLKARNRGGSGYQVSQIGKSETKPDAAYWAEYFKKKDELKAAGFSEEDLAEKLAQWTRERRKK